jgi:hypothetical protein
VPPEPSKPYQLQITGKPWSLVFAPHPRLLDQQAVFLFNEESGEFWELIAGTFVLRPRDPKQPSADNTSA